MEVINHVGSLKFIRKIIYCIKVNQSAFICSTKTIVSNENSRMSIVLNKNQITANDEGVEPLQLTLGMTLTNGHTV